MCHTLCWLAIQPHACGFIHCHLLPLPFCGRHMKVWPLHAPPHVHLTDCLSAIGPRHWPRQLPRYASHRCTSLQNSAVPGDEWITNRSKHRQVCFHSAHAMPGKSKQRGKKNDLQFRNQTSATKRGPMQLPGFISNLLPGGWAKRFNTCQLPVLQWRW